MSKATPPRDYQTADTERTESQTIARVTYRNGSGYRTLDAADYRVTDAGHLKVVDEHGRGHLFSAGAEWKVSEVRDA
jgi:hypothetical protein